MTDSQFTHINQHGEAHMVDITAKAATCREARAEAYVYMQPETLALIAADQIKKGDVLATARIAGIQAAKKTWELIPLCHPLLLSKVEINIESLAAQSCLRVESYCRLTGQTGVEMEAMVAAATAALTIYDMCKAVQKDIRLTDVRLLSKSGGKSGDFKAGEL